MGNVSVRREKQLPGPKLTLSGIYQTRAIHTYPRDIGSRSARPEPDLPPWISVLQVQHPADGFESTGRVDARPFCAQTPPWRRATDGRSRPDQSARGTGHSAYWSGAGEARLDDAKGDAEPEVYDAVG